MEEDINFPDVNYGSNNEEFYEQLITQTWSPFYKHRIWEVFIFCMSYAYAKKLNPIRPDGKGTLNAKVFGAPVRHLMRALAIDYFDDLSVIKDSNKVVKICEEFANAGIKDVYYKFKENSTPINIFLEMKKDIEDNTK